MVVFQKVVSIQAVHCRLKGLFSLIHEFTGMRHSGNMVILESGDKYLVHVLEENNNYHLKIKKIDDLLPSWKPVGELYCPENKYFSELIKFDDKEYSTFFYNCHDWTTYHNPNVKSVVFDIEPIKS